MREYRERLRWLKSNGIVVMSIFILGLDGDTPEYLRRLPELIDDVGVDVPVLTLPVPIEGTPLRRELQEAGRLLGGPSYGSMDGVQVNFRPQHLSGDELELLFHDALRRVHSRRAVLRRMWRSLGALPSGAFAALLGLGCNLLYRTHQLDIARVGRERRRARQAALTVPALASVEAGEPLG